MGDNHEVEIRGVLTNKQFGELKKRLTTEAKFEKSFKRLTVDLSPGFNPQAKSWNLKRARLLDLRLKKSNEEEKISLKYGHWADKRREEYDIMIAPGQFMKMVKMFNSLGFETGMIYFWESWVYEYEGAEVKISQYTKDYFMWEIDARDQTEEGAEEKVEEVASKLGLHSLTEEEYRKEIDYVNQNIFPLFSYETAEELLNQHFSS